MEHFSKVILAPSLTQNNKKIRKDSLLSFPKPYRYKSVVFLNLLKTQNFSLKLICPILFIYILLPITN